MYSPEGRALWAVRYQAFQSSNQDLRLSPYVTANTAELQSNAV